MYKELEHGLEGYSASTAYMSHCNSVGMVPSPVGLVSKNGLNNSVKAKNLKMGSEYGMALSKSMKHLGNTTTIELPGNRLGKVGGNAIICSLPENIRILNLANNKIG